MWDCTKAKNDYKLQLIAGGLALGLVDLNEAVSAGSNWSLQDNKIIEEQIGGEAVRIAKNIKERDLICRDLDEP